MSKSTKILMVFHEPFWEDDITKPKGGFYYSDTPIENILAFPYVHEKGDYLFYYLFII